MASLDRKWVRTRFEELIDIEERLERRLLLRRVGIQEVWTRFDRVWGGPF